MKLPPQRMKPALLVGRVSKNALNLLSWVVSGSHHSHFRLFPQNLREENLTKILTSLNELL